MFCLSFCTPYFPRTNELDDLCADSTASGGQTPWPSLFDGKGEVLASLDVAP